MGTRISPQIRKIWEVEITRSFATSPTRETTTRPILLKFFQLSLRNMTRRPSRPSHRTRATTIRVVGQVSQVMAVATILAVVGAFLAAAEGEAVASRRIPRIRAEVQKSPDVKHSPDVQFEVSLLLFTKIQ